MNVVLKPDMLRNHIAHVMPKIEVSGIYTLVTTLIKEMASSHQHTILNETPWDELDIAAYMQLQANGANVLQVECVTPELLDDNYTGAVFYNLVGHADLGSCLPSVYYSAGVYDPAVNASVVVPCSAYAAVHDWHGGKYDAPLNTELMIPAITQTRAMRRLRMRGKRPDFSVGLLTSGADDKYPGKLVIDLLSTLPEDVLVYVTVLPKYPHPGVPLAVDDRLRRERAIGCVVKPQAGLYYLLHLDVLVYGTSSNYFEPAGRFVIEAAAAGIPVVCEARGFFAQELQHEWNAMLFNTSEEAQEHVLRLRTDTDLRERLIANGQLWASWYDTAVHMGKFRAILRELGI